MSWEKARDTLLEQLRTLGSPVNIAPPLSLDDNRLHISLTPPPRTTERRPGGVRHTFYEQRIALIGRLSTDNNADGIDALALEADALAERINTLLDQNLQLGNDAVIVGPPTWEELDVQEYPSQSGLLAIVMFCTITIEVEVINAFKA